MTKIKFIFITLCTISIFHRASAQNSTITPIETLSNGADAFPIFSYGDKFVYSDEFMRVFNKNKQGDAIPTQQEIEEYLDLYIKFKLKVEQAYRLKMDTLPSFIKELAGYRKQLAQPYLTDKTVTDRLINEAYERSISEVRASHLLINCSSDAKPQDTLKAYQKIMGLRSRIQKGGDFKSLAEEFSEDPSAKTNRGDLGYFTAFQMIYPFENAAFQTPVGQVSRPIRTQFGYHLVFVEDRRPAQGDIKVAHIMIKYYNPAQIDSTKERIEAVYTKLQDGADWNTLVLEFSEDFNTNNQGGELSWINRTTPNIPIEFKDVAYTLKTDGDISKPIKTRFGWHIVKRLESKPLPTLNDSREIIRRKVERDSRSELNKDVVVARIKNENNFRELAGIKAVKDSFTDLLLEGKYRKQKGKGIVLLTIGDREYTDDYFFGYVATNQNKSNKSLSNTVQDYYDDFIKRVNLDYEEGLLEQKYEDFKNIMQEYKDGILLFELTDKKVWSKAIKDSSGLALFYSKNIDNYMWKERLDASIYSCVDKKSAKRAMKLAKKGKSSGEILSKCNMDNAIAVKVESTKFERNSKPILDQINWEKGVQKLADENERFKFVVIHEVLPPTQKLLDENRGIVTSDYQNYLEKKWIEQLNTLFPVQLFENNISRLYSNP